MGQNAEIMTIFTGETKTEIATKEISKGSHKIEISEKEKDLRNKYAQSVYHKGEGVDVKDSIYKGGSSKAVITIEKEDQQEL